MAFVVIALVGVAVVVAFRGWPWIVHAGLWPSFVEAAKYLDDPHHSTSHATLAGGWWLVLAAGPIAFELRSRSEQLRAATTVSIVTIGSASCVLAAIALHDDRVATGWYMVGLGVVYGVLTLGATISGLPRVTSIWTGIAGAISAGAGGTLVLGSGPSIEIGALWCAEGSRSGGSQTGKMTISSSSRPS